MNKTLLLILCDFLLLTLLALTRWESAEPPRPVQAPVSQTAGGVATREQDLVETMRQALADEQAGREALNRRLAEADAALAARDQNLAQLQQERAQLAEERNVVASTLTETQRAAAELSQRVTQATQEATMTKEQLAQLQRELADREAESERQRQALARLEQQQAEARRQIEGLTLAVVVAEQEKKNLRETTDTLRSQVEAERSERLKVQESNTRLAQASTQLAQGVGQLAERSGELTREIRENRPINANVLYQDFISNRVMAAFSASRRGFLGEVNRNRDAATVLVSDGRQTYALLHVADTVFSFGESGIDWESIAVELAHGGDGRIAADALWFLAQDPRIVVLPLAPAQVAALGANVYGLAAEPFKFPEAVLIDGGGRGYGEVSFKLDAGNPGYVRVDNRLFRRVFGDFSPKRGDLVFSKAGAFLGIMVNDDYCAVVRNLAAAKTIQPGPETRAQETGTIFEELSARVRSMPIRLQ